jgi:RNA polymerase primary sigma factor
MSNEELVKNIQQGIDSSNNMRQLYQQNYGIILKIAKRYAYNNDVEDLTQEAYFGLYEAVNRYEDTHETTFITYAAYWVQQAIQRYLENNGDLVRLPVGLNGRMYQYKKMVGTYEKELNRKPTDREVCKHLNIGIKALESLKASIHSFDKLDSLDREMQGEDDSSIIGDTVADNVDVENHVVDSIMKNEIKTELWKIVKENTTNEECEVLKDRYIRSMTLEATGQHIGKSRDMARQIEAKALRKLRNRRVSRVMAEKFEVNNARVYNGSFAMFKNTGSSIVEDIAIKNLEFEATRY